MSQVPLFKQSGRGTQVGVGVIVGALAGVMVGVLLGGVVLALRSNLIPEHNWVVFILAHVVVNGSWLSDRGTLQ